MSRKDNLGSAAKPPPRERLDVLLVEDSVADADLVVRELRRLGFQVEPRRVEDGDGMRSALGERSWDVVLCDHVLPSFDSTLALELLHELSPETPMIIVSGAIGEEAAVHALQRGASDYVNKDHLDRLGSAVRHSLREFNALRARRRAEAKLRQSEDRFRTAVDSMLDCFGIFSAVRDEQGRIVEFRVEYLNDAACDLSGLTRAQQIGTTVRDFLPGHGETGLFEKQCRVVDTGEPLAEELVTYDDGAAMEKHLEEAFEIRAAKLGDGFAAAWRDITTRRQSAESVARLAAIVESSRDAIIGKTLDGTIFNWNPGAERLYGYSAAEMIGKPVSSLVPEERLDELEEILEKVSRGESVDRHETMGRTKDGRRVDISLTVSPITDSAGEIIGASTIAGDITERKRLESRLRYLADHDVLTGLYNRRRFEEELAREVAYATRYDLAAAVLILDLDNFKYVNDSLGHVGGDEILRSVASLMRKRLRDGDILARLGGDEFAVVLSHLSGDEARTFAKALQGAVGRHAFFVRGQRVALTASVGVAVLEPDVDAAELMINADLAMHGAKEGGRDRVVVYSAARGRTAQMEVRLTWMERIRTALQEGMFTLYSEPILDLHSGEVTQREILLRMRGDNDEMILPGAFLGPAERFGLIQELDRWVVREAIRLIAAERQAGRPLRLEVNLSAKSMGDQNQLVGVIQKELSETGVEPADLIFEVTETSAIANMEEARLFAETLRQLGCQFALDDFGAGFGSFYYLKYLPVNYIKIDGDFIRDLPNSPTDQVLVKAMVEVASGLGMKTIAEFVQNEATLELLRGYGVDYAQGSHIAPPAPVSGLAVDLGSAP